METVTISPKFVDGVLGQFGEERWEAQRLYRRFVLEGVGKGSPWEEVKGQIVLGGQGFVKRLERYFRKVVGIREEE